MRAQAHLLQALQQLLREEHRAVSVGLKVDAQVGAVGGLVQVLDAWSGNSARASLFRAYKLAGSGTQALMVCKCFRHKSAAISRPFASEERQSQVPNGACMGACPGPICQLHTGNVKARGHARRSGANIVSISWGLTIWPTPARTCGRARDWQLQHVP